APDAEKLSDGGAGARSDAAFFHSFGSGRRGRGYAHGDIRMHARLADGEIEQDRRGNDGNVLAAESEAHFARRQVAAHTRGGFQSEGAAAGQQNAVHLVGDVAGAKHVDLLRAAGAAADVHAAHRARFAENRRAAGERFEIGDVTHADAG